MPIELGLDAEYEASLPERQRRVRSLLRQVLHEIHAQSDLREEPALHSFATGLNEARPFQSQERQSGIQL